MYITGSKPEEYVQSQWERAILQMFCIKILGFYSVAEKLKWTRITSSCVYFKALCKSWIISWSFLLPSWCKYWLFSQQCYHNLVLQPKKRWGWDWRLSIQNVWLWPCRLCLEFCFSAVQYVLFFFFVCFNHNDHLILMIQLPKLFQTQNLEVTLGGQYVNG